MKQAGVTTSIKAKAALEPMYFIGLDGDICGAGAKALGVSASAAAIDEQLAVDVTGILEVIAGAAVAAGAAVKSDSQGRAITALAAALTLDTPAGTVDFPTSSSVAMKSSSEHPAFTFTGSALAGTAALTGGVLPIAVNGYALDAASQAGDIIRIMRV